MSIFEPIIRGLKRESKIQTWYLSKNLHSRIFPQNLSLKNCTICNKFCTAAGSDGSDKCHLCLDFWPLLHLRMREEKSSWSEFISSHYALFEGKHTLTCPMEKQSAWVQFDLTLLVDCDLNSNLTLKARKAGSSKAVQGRVYILIPLCKQNVTPRRMLENWIQIAQIDRHIDSFQNMYDML